MPNVNGKKFSYDKKGMADAKDAKKAARRNALKAYMDKSMGKATK